MARKIAREKILPVRAELDEKEEFPWEIVKISAAAGLMGVSIPVEYEGFGGGDSGILSGRGGIEPGLPRCRNQCGGQWSGRDAHPDLREPRTEEALPSRYRKGDRLAAFGLTEAEAGSDAGSIRTTATRTADGYLLNGTKQWITNGGEAEIYTIIAMTDRSKGPRGASAFIVEKGAQGFTFGKKEKKMGIRASATRELVFQDCFVPKGESDREGRHGLYRHHEDLRPNPARSGGTGGRGGTGRPG